MPTSMRELIKLLTPPIIWNIISNLYRSIKTKHSGDSYETINNYQIILKQNQSPVILEYLTGNHGFSIPPNKIRYSGGLSYM